MRRRLSRVTLPTALAGVAIIAAGCGGGYTAASGGGAQTASAPTVRAAHSPLGTILVDGQVAGAWKHAGGRITVEEYRPLSRPERREVSEEADRLTTIYAEQD